MLCTDLTFVKVVTNRIYAEPIRCRSWSCHYCNPRRKRQLIAKAASGRPDTFLTLTASPQTADTPLEAARILVTAWRKVRAEACRRYGYEMIPFIAVFEATKKGWPHLHVLIRCKWIDQAWLSERMMHHARAPIVDIRRVENQQAVARYLFKYIGKEPHKFGTCKRYWTSKTYEAPHPRRYFIDRASPDQCRVAFRRFSLYLLDREQEGFLLDYDGEGVWLRWPGNGPEPPDQ